MKLTNLRLRLAKRFGSMVLTGATLVPGLAVLSGGMAFVGQAHSAELLSNRSFENPSPDGWAPGFGQYSHLSQVYYDGPAPAGAGEFYGWRWSDTTGVGNSASQTVSVAGDAPYNFEAWLAGWTGDGSPGGDYAEVSLEWFDGGGISLGSVLFDGQDAASPSIVGSADANGAPDPTIPFSEDNWTLYRDSATTPTGAASAVVTLTQATGNFNGNDAYVDLVSLDTVPEPGSVILLGLGGLMLLGRRRR